MTLTVERELSLSGGQRRRLPLLAGAAPVAGALLSWDASGYVHGLIAGEAFAGVCRVSVRKAFATDGEGQVDVVTGQFDLRSLAAIATIDATDVASATPIYASDDATMTATAAGNTHVGAVAGIDSDGRVQIAAATAEVAAAVASPDDVGGMFGAKTIVVSTAGDDTAGAASKYAAEFLTIQAAITAAAAGDCVLVRPGAYAPTASIIPKTGVPIYFMPGAVVTTTAAPGTPTFYDNGATVPMQILGYGKFLSADREQLVQLGASSTCRFECQEIDYTSGPTISQPLFSGYFGGTKTLSVLCRGPLRTSGLLLKGSVDVFNVDIVCHEPIVAAQLVDDSGSTGATRMSIKAPKITATDAGEYGFKLHAAAPARYDVDCDDLVASVSTDAAATTALYLRTRSHLSHTPNLEPLRLGLAKHFIWTGETRGQDGGGGNAALRTQQGAVVNLLGGRFVGADGDPSGNAITFATDAPLVNVHPGVVLIAGSDGGAKSVGIAGAAATPTINLLGAIAANKAADGGVLIAVGSLLVDAAVV